MLATRLSSLWYRLRTGFWFVPASMALAMLLLAALLVSFGDQLPKLPGQWRFLLSPVQPDSIRSLLSTIAGAIISGAAVTYSLTMVAMSLAASQFGPRLLSVLMGDRPSQVVLGIFISTFLFCLGVLGYMPASHPAAPLALALALALALFSFFGLIYFVHHVANLMHVETVIEQVTRDLRATMDKLYPDQAKPQDEDGPAWTGHHLLEHGDPATLNAPRSGYVQALDTAALAAKAAKHDLLLVLLVRTGDFAHQGQSLAKVYAAETLDDDLTDTLRGHLLLSAQRAPYQDLEYSLNQLVEVALRALSPGINDTFTALTCVDRLGAALATLAGRKLPGRQHQDEEGVLRLVTKPMNFSDALERAFPLIRQNSAGNPAVCARLLEAMTHVAGNLVRPQDEAPLLAQADLVLRGCLMPLAEDRQPVVRRYRQFLLMLGRDASAVEENLWSTGADD